MTRAARRIGMVAPSGFLPDRGVLDRAVAFFSARGWEVEIGESCVARELRFAGPDDMRHADLFRFATDPSIDIVLAARGGYGLTRFLDRVDFTRIRARTPIVVGYSDFTAFHLAYLAAGGVSFAGPSAGDFGAPAPDAFTVEHFFGVLENADYAIHFDADGPDCAVRGRLWGGNLALVCALIGTRFMPRIAGGILFLEDVNEPAYKIERMLLQLDQAGILARQRAILLGAFDPVTPMPNDNGYDISSAVAFLRGRSTTPIIAGLPFGHVARKLTLPVGGHAKFAVRHGRAQLALTRYPVLGER
ncbi:MAG TPA: LD-carboxypeptidase [Burkholderiales bacterium]|nr:LD-carboxypeptidase [Burkholderiales bacterium]